MNHLKSFFLSVCFVATSIAAFGSSPIVSEGTSELHAEISTYLKDIVLEDSQLETTTRYIKFIIDDDNKLIVLSSSNDELSQVIKSKLNYRTIRTKAKQNNLVYAIPVTIQKL